MNNKQKYYNYIVDDLVSKTKVDHEERSITMTWMTDVSEFTSKLAFGYFRLMGPSTFRFMDYVIPKFGMRDEEVTIVLDMYREKMKTLIDNEQ